MNVDAIFFDAHPDDIELSCGGTIRVSANSSIPQRRRSCSGVIEAL